MCVIKQQKCFFLIKNQLTAFKVANMFSKWIVGNSYMKMLEWNLERRSPLNRNCTQENSLSFTSTFFPPTSFNLRNKFTLPRHGHELSDHFRTEAQRSHVNNSRYSVKCVDLSLTNFFLVLLCEQLVSPTPNEGILFQPVSKILSLHYAED